LAAEPKGRPEPQRADAPLLVEGRRAQGVVPVRGGLLRRRPELRQGGERRSLQLRAGTTLGVVGESGSGKTTLGLALLRLVDSEGAIRFAGRDIRRRAAEAPAFRCGREMQIVFQDPYSSLSPRLSIAQIVGEGLRVHHLAKDEDDARRRIDEALIEVGLEPDVAERYPHEFSGGQRQRVAIARALVLKPRFRCARRARPRRSNMSVQAQIVDFCASCSNGIG